jgi:hypothetical protein
VSKAKQDKLPDGREVVQRVRAKIQSPIDGELYETKTIDELLLDDESVVYQCVHPSAVSGCDYIENTVKSVVSHQRVHGRAMAKKLAERAEAAESALADIHAKNSDRAKRAAKTRNEKRQNQMNGESEHPLELTSNPVVDHLNKQISRISESLGEMASGMLTISNELMGVQKALSSMPLATADIIEKAARFDQIRGAFKE